MLGFITITVFLLIFLFFYFIVGLNLAILLTFLIAFGYFSFNFYQTTTGLTRIMLKMYYQIRLIGKNHEDTINSILDIRLKRRNIEQYNYVKSRMDYHFYMHESQGVQIDLLMLCYLIMLIENNGKIENMKLYETFSNKFLKEYKKHSKMLGELPL